MAYKQRASCLKVSSTALFLIFFQLINAQDFFRADDFLRQNFKSLGEELVVLVQKDGKLIYKKELGKDFTVNSTVAAEEISQWFTAITVLQQQDEGKYTIDDKVSKYIPRFEQYMKGYITIRHCLTHTAGLDGGKEGVGKVLGKNPFDNLTDEVDTYISKRDIVANPGEAFAYNRVGIAIAARTAEVVSKKSFDRLAMEKVFRPLGMRQTLFINDNAKVDPMNGALTTGQDCILFMQMLLNKGTLNGKKILNESSVDELRKLQFTEARVVFKPIDFKDADYTLTTWVSNKDDQGNANVIRQGTTGNQALIDFSKNMAIVVLLKDGGGEKKKLLVNELMKLLHDQ